MAKKKDTGKTKKAEKAAGKDAGKVKKLSTKEYEAELERLQGELVKLQFIAGPKHPAAVIAEGRSNRLTPVGRRGGGGGPLRR